MLLCDVQAQSHLCHQLFPKAPEVHLALQALRCACCINIVTFLRVLCIVLHELKPPVASLGGISPQIFLQDMADLKLLLAPFNKDQSLSLQQVSKHYEEPYLSGTSVSMQVGHTAS